jgi:multidrug efflux system membrane fusion protein
VVVSTASNGDLPVFYNGLGTVNAFNTVTVRSRIDGQLLRVAFQEGQLVKEGDVLAEIDPRPYQVQLEQAQGQLARDVAQQQDAIVNLERYKLLYKEGVIPKQQLDTQQASVGQFDGAIQTDKATIDNAKLNIVYCRITAPISGRIGLRLVDAGNMVHATDTSGLLVITQLQPISVLFSLPQDQLPVVYKKLRGGQQLTVEAYDRDNTSKITTGKLLTIDNQIDPTTGTYKLKAVFKNEDNALFPNQFVNIHLLVDTLHNIVLVPTTAILRGSQGVYVFAVTADGTVKVKSVTVANTNGNTTGVSAGLKSGEVVVVDGQDKLQDGSKVDAKPATNSAPAPNTSASNAANSPFASSSRAANSGGGPAR